MCAVPERRTGRGMWKGEEKVQDDGEHLMLGHGMFDYSLDFRMELLN